MIQLYKILAAQNSKRSSSADHPSSVCTTLMYVSSLVSSPLLSIIIVIIHRHVIHCKPARITLRQSLHRLAFTGTLNPPTPTHSHSSFILCRVINIIIVLSILF